jgi:hypothetical protein
VPCHVSPLPLSRVRWAPPFDSSEHDSWEPLYNLQKSPALRTFLKTKAWLAFTASREFREFASQYGSAVRLPGPAPKHSSKAVSPSKLLPMQLEK